MPIVLIVLVCFSPVIRAQTFEPHFSLLREAGSLEDAVKEMGLDPADWSAVSAAVTWSSQTSVCPAHHASFDLQSYRMPACFVY